MSGLVIDTHVLIWFLSGDEKLGSRAVDLLEDAAAANSLFVSAITPWEIGMLVSKSRLKLAKDVGDWVADAMALPGIRLAALDPKIAIASTRLPWEFHGDPADRIIVATARALEIPLMTADLKLLDYGAAGHFKVINCGL
ncbi:type II toxin-antitoxin system VapC family toxin [Silvimonas sp. JCM 19000]